MEKKFLIIITSICLLTFTLLSILLCTAQTLNSQKIYITALSNYNDSNFQDAKKYFKKVSIFSPLKPAAIYREAVCAKKLKNEKEELKKYNKIKTFFPNSRLASGATFSAAKINYQNKKYSKALKGFKFNTKKYPETKYSIASNYFIALCESEKNPNNTKKLREIISRAKKYLIKSPNGIYALNCAKLLEKYPLSEEEKLLVGKTFMNFNDFDNALKYLHQVDIKTSWPYLVQIYYAQKNYDKVQNFTRLGLSTNNNITTKEHNNAGYKAVDLYLKTFDNRKNALTSLLNIGAKNNIYDYLMFENCNNSSEESKYLCYSSVYQLYPNGNFSAESLANMFLYNIQKENYQEAIKLGKLHLLNYKDAKSTPKVMYWLANISILKNNSKDARYYYNLLMKEYPDDYYTYLAFITTNKAKYGIDTKKLTLKPIEFPYKNIKDKLLTSLLEVEDYGMINQFYDNDEFIKSWILYKRGDYSSSSRIARDAMEKLKEKPSKDDLRWRLVYPIHYYEEIEQNALPSTDKTLILSIIREESYFNPEAKSPADARGLMQLMPSTALDIAKRTKNLLPNSNILYNPSINIKLGINYFAFLKLKSSGNPRMAVLAYNGGIGAVNRWKKQIKYNSFEEFIEMIPFSETENYFKKVYRSYWNYLRIYNGINF